MKFTGHAGCILLFVTLILACSGCTTVKTGEQSWWPEILSSSSEVNVYLPDFSFAGYKWGEQPIPQLKPTMHVADFGAIPDDEKDDTEALKEAFRVAHTVEGPVVLKFAKGRYILSDILYIDRSQFVLQGAGSGTDGTIIYMPQPLNKLATPADMTELEEYLNVNNKRQREPDRGIDERFSLYAWSGGYIWTRKPGEPAKPYMSKYYTAPRELAQIKNGLRGSQVIEVDDAKKLHVDQIVRINWYNREGENSSLIKHMYNNVPVSVGSRHWESPEMALIKQEVTVSSINGNLVTIKEKLMHDLRAEWYPNITEWNYISEVGIEHLRFEFPFEEYFAHHLEAGYNAIYMTNTAHSWVRDVSVHNGDSGFISDICANVTVEDVVLTGRMYHYAVQFGDCYDMLAKNIKVDCPVKHSLSFNTGARNCVFTNSLVTTAPSLDQHSGANHQNLFDDIKLIENDPSRTFFYMGGDGYWAPTHGAFSTFWNIQVDFKFSQPDQLPLSIKGVTNGPSARLVGITANYPMEISYGPESYTEGINRSGIAVTSLYEYQLKKRLSGF
ncbi:MAG: hypothetical protein E4H13_01245 [Calditrichales bacterium]|nr:MAG: hypothetical protein E4H13_01245 [Calditrichales bacterium]